MEIQVLGPVEVRDNDAEVPLRGPRQRRLLAALVIHAGKVVSVERLIDAVWAGEEPPERAGKTLNTYLSRLRPTLGDGLVQKRDPGYSLVVDPDKVDATHFERMVAAARARLEAGDAAEAKVRLDEALALWNGPAYDEFASEPWAWAAASRLEELRLSAREDRAEALRILGETAEAVGELERLTVEFPLRERSRHKLMLRCRSPALVRPAHARQRRPPVRVRLLRVGRRSACRPSAYRAICAALRHRPKPGDRGHPTTGVAPGTAPVIRGRPTWRRNVGDRGVLTHSATGHGRSS